MPTGAKILDWGLKKRVYMRRNEDNEERCRGRKWPGMQVLSLRLMTGKLVSLVAQVTLHPKAPRFRPDIVKEKIISEWQRKKEATWKLRASQEKKNPVCKNKLVEQMRRNSESRSQSWSRSIWFRIRNHLCPPVTTSSQPPRTST